VTARIRTDFTPKEPGRPVTRTNEENMSPSTTEHRLLSNRYRIENFLGQGGMARVHRGTDLVLERTVAIKILAEHMLRDPHAVQRFRREAQAAAGLSHPGIVAVYDTGSDGDTHYIVMEYVTGRTLADILDEGGALLPKRAVEIALAVASALGVAHAKGIVHRDVKPGNIMITPTGQVKVMDFGIARAVSADTFTQTASVLGTATYFAPEQARGEPVDARSDLYALGVVTYETLTGRPPFAADSPVAVAFQHVREQPTPPSRLNPDIGSALEAVVLKAMAKEPEARYQTADELGQDLRRVRAGRVVGPGAAARAAPGPAETTQPIPVRGTSALPPVAPTGRAAPPGRRLGTRWAPWLTALGALLAIALIAGLVLAGLSRRPTGGLQPTSPTATAPSNRPSTSPSPQEQSSLSVQGASNQVALILTEGVANGDLSRHAANEIGKDVNQAVKNYQSGDVEEALRDLDELQHKIEVMGSKGEIGTDRATRIRQAISDLMAAMQAAPPSGGGGED